MTKPKADTKRKFTQSYGALAVAWLKTLDPGTQVTTVQVANALGVTGSVAVHNLRAGLRICRDIRGVHVSRGEGQRGGYITLWSLTAHEPVPLPEQKRTRKELDLLPRRTHAPGIQPRPGLLFPGVYATEVMA